MFHNPRCIARVKRDSFPPSERSDRKGEKITLNRGEQGETNHSWLAAESINEPPLNSDTEMFLPVAYLLNVQRERNEVPCIRRDRNIRHNKTRLIYNWPGEKVLEAGRESPRNIGLSPLQ